MGTVGDALDNALMESQLGLYKTELIKPRRPWHGPPDVALATAEWVDWFDNQRLHTAIGTIPRHEHETDYYARHQPTRRTLRRSCGTRIWTSMASACAAATSATESSRSSTR
ncbi:integrase core domain-containing protein [Streptomyces prasinus]|uniref:integrase core domain-containing protein n=1 Tax=Streptomyces prasinus TaxID=67345 RepID=UPI0033BEA323